MASVPAKQLNSKKIRSALISTILTTVQGCSLITTKMCYDGEEQGYPSKVEHMWKDICKKRDACDQAIKKVKGVAFFFSAIASKEKKAQTPPNGDQENASQETSSKTYLPAMSNWIALRSKNGVLVSTVPIHSALLDIGVEVEPKSLPSCVSGKEENCASPLCTVLKDHNNAFMQQKVNASFANSLEIMQDQIMDEPVGSPSGSEHVVRLCVVSPHFTETLRSKAIPALVRAGLVFDVFGIEERQTENPPEPGPVLASPIVVALNDIERAVTKLGYALHRGEIFKKVPDSRFTLEYCCSVKKFLTILGSNQKFKEPIIRHCSHLVAVLGDPESEMFHQVQINYNLIEVADGWCFAVDERKFIQNAIQEVGRVSPRAFIRYDHKKSPEPGYFKEILENSLGETEMRYFCEYYLRLLNHGGKQHKEKVICLVGEPNSGKTSLFTPLTTVIPSRYIAMISKQRAFNKSMIDEDTQVIFLDEAYAGMLDPDDWKMLTQGGMSAYDRKYKSATAMVIRCPMFITCQTDMDFGDKHNAAMAVRLRKFHFKRLNTTTVAGVQQSLKEHAMDCLVWASNKAETPPDEFPLQMATQSSKDQAMNAEEKERIRTLNIDEEESDDATSAQQLVDLDSSEEGSDEEATESSDFWERHVNKISELQEQEPKHSLRQRQLVLIGAEMRRVADESKKGLEEREQALLEDTRRRWVAMRMIEEEDAHLLTSVQGPFHQNIEKSREDYFARKKKDEEEMLEQKAIQYYNNEWVFSKEAELRELQKKEDDAVDPDMKRALTYMIEVARDALRLKFQDQEIPGLRKYALQERKTKAVEMKWISLHQVERVSSIWDPLPYPSEVAQDSYEDIFITPVAAPKATQPQSQESRFRSHESNRTPKRRRASKGSVTVSKKGRITSFFPPSQM